MKKIAANEFKELYQTSEITVLDVREKEEFQDGHIPTAKNYPLSTLEIKSGAKILRHLPRRHAFSTGLSIFGRKRL